MTSASLGQEQECRVYERDEWYTLIDYVLFLKHQRAYLESMEDVRGKTVLDFGCGSGYGADILAQTAASVIGVDASDEALKAAQVYRRPNLLFERIQPDYTLRLDDDAFDIVTSHQVIEHIPDVARYLELLKRVLKPGGKLVLSTPNRKFRLLPFQRIWQEAHVREYSEPELKRDLARVFERFEIKGIVGSDAFHAAYMNHYRQTPLKAYVKQPLKSLLRSVLPKSVYAKLRDKSGLGYRVSTTPIPHAVLAQYSLDDVAVEIDTSRALDFFAICYK